MNFGILFVVGVLVVAFLLDKLLDRAGPAKGDRGFFNPSNRAELYHSIESRSAIASPAFVWGVFLLNVFFQFALLYPYRSFANYLLLAAGGAGASLLLLLFPPKSFRCTPQSHSFIRSRRYRRFIGRLSFWPVLAPLGCYLASFLAIPDNWLLFHRKSSGPETTVQMMFLGHTVLSWVFLAGNLYRFAYKNWKQIMEE